MYLKSMMDSWDGSTGREVILELLTYIPMSSFDGMTPDAPAAYLYPTY